MSYAGLLSFFVTATAFSIAGCSQSGAPTTSGGDADPEGGGGDATIPPPTGAGGSPSQSSGGGSVGAGGDAGGGEAPVGDGCEPAVPAPSGGSCIAVTPPQPSGSFKVDCNPVTGAPCPTDLTCDVVFQSGAFMGFQCYPPPNVVPACGACDALHGPFCQVHHTCVEGQCRRFCCEDADCGPAAHCVSREADLDSYPGAPGLGHCLPD